MTPRRPRSPKHLDAGRTVAVLSGRRSAVLRLLHASACAARPALPVEIVAGVTGMSGCWSAAGAPIAQGDDVFTVLPATLPQHDLERRLADCDAAVLMKLGRHLPKVRRALEKKRPARLRHLCGARHHAGRPC